MSPHHKKTAEPIAYTQCLCLQGHAFETPITFKEDFSGSCRNFKTEGYAIPHCKELDRACDFYMRLPDRPKKDIAQLATTTETPRTNYEKPQPKPSQVFLPLKPKKVAQVTPTTQAAQS